MSTELPSPFCGIHPLGTPSHVNCSDCVSARAQLVEVLRSNRESEERRVAQTVTDEARDLLRAYGRGTATQCQYDFMAEAVVSLRELVRVLDSGRGNHERVVRASRKQEVVSVGESESDESMVDVARSVIDKLSEHFSFVSGEDVAASGDVNFDGHVISDSSAASTELLSGDREAAVSAADVTEGTARPDPAGEGAPSKLLTVEQALRLRQVWVHKGPDALLALLADAITAAESLAVWE